MRYEAETGEVRRNSGVHAQSTTGWRARIAPPPMCGLCAVIRQKRRESGAVKSFVVIVLVLPAVIAALFVAVTVLGAVAKLFPQ